MPRFGIFLGALAIALGIGSGVGWAQAPVGRSDETAGKVLDITGKVLDIVGLASEVKGISLGIPGSHVTVTPQEIRIELAADILFDFDKAELKPQAQQALKQVAQVIRDRAKSTVMIEGYTDAKGSDRYNQKLSERRAQTVRKWLIERKGLGAVRMTARGYGKNKPVAPNTKPDGSDDPEGRQKNRRVEIVIRNG
jgi:outer membrane protein OmpA-like peptidoglycan-associated protein